MEHIKIGDYVLVGNIVSKVLDIDEDGEVYVSKLGRCSSSQCTKVELVNDKIKKGFYEAGALAYVSTHGVKLQSTLTPEQHGWIKAVYKNKVYTACQNDYCTMLYNDKGAGFTINNKELTFIPSQNKMTLEEALEFAKGTGLSIVPISYNNKHSHQFYFIDDVFMEQNESEKPFKVNLKNYIYHKWCVHENTQERYHDVEKREMVRFNELLEKHGDLIREIYEYKMLARKYDKPIVPLKDNK